MLTITTTRRRDLRAEAHHLNPVVSIAGNGLTASVLKEIDLALKSHELIKIRVYGDDREARAAYLEQICAELDCAAVQNIGKLLVVFRPNPELHERNRRPPRMAAASLQPPRPTSTSARVVRPRPMRRAKHLLARRNSATASLLPVVAGHARAPVKSQKGCRTRHPFFCPARQA